MKISIIVLLIIIALSSSMYYAGVSINDMGQSLVDSLDYPVQVLTNSHHTLTSILNLPATLVGFFSKFLPQQNPDDYIGGDFVGGGAGGGGIGSIIYRRNEIAQFYQWEAAQGNIGTVRLSYFMSRYVLFYGAKVARSWWSGFDTFGGFEPDKNNPHILPGDPNYKEN